MFFSNKRNKQNVKNIMKINVFENKTDISIHKGNNQFSYFINSIDFGYKDVITNSYKNLKLLSKYKDLSLDDFIENQSNILRDDISRFVQHIEFKILCGPSLPCKIDSVQFECDGPELFKKELKSKFLFY